MKKIWICLFAVFALLFVLGGCRKEHTHEFGNWKISLESTCTSEGLREHVCACGYRESEPIPSKEHSVGEWKTVTDATCEQEGLRERVCACGYRESEAIPPSEHRKGDWKVVQTATCSEEGELQRHCLDCDALLAQKAFAKIAHKASEAVREDAVEETCTKDGFYRSVVRCAVCESVIESHDVTVPAGHVEDEWVIDTPATCTEEGARHMDCARCEERLYTETLPVLPHSPRDPIHENEFPATCTSEGSYESVTKCSSCEIELSRETVVLPITHAYDNRVCGLCEALQASEGLIFEERGEGYAVTGIGTCTDEWVIIPETYLGKPVTVIAEWAFSENCAFVHEVTVPASVTTVEFKAFRATLRKITFLKDSQLTYIANNAFANTQLTELILPEGLKVIGAGAFGSCSSLQSITIPSSVEKIEKNAFRDCYNLENVFIEDIDKWCAIEFGDEKANPTKYANTLYLTDGTLIEHLQISEGITHISAFAFYEVTSIKSITVPSTLKSIGSNAFYGCNQLKNTYISDLEGFCEISFANAGAGLGGGSLYLNDVLVNELCVPDGVSGIGAYAFAGYSCILSVYLPDSVESLGDGAFMGCTGMLSIRLPAGLTEIPKSLLQGNASLSAIEIPETVTFIGESAFERCEAIEAFYIPAAVLRIGKHAFEGCTGVTEFIFACTEGWNCGEHYQISKWHLETSAKTVKIVKEYNFAEWWRAEV